MSILIAPMSSSSILSFDLKLKNKLLPYPSLWLRNGPAKVTGMLEIGVCCRNPEGARGGLICGGNGNLLSAVGAGVALIIPNGFPPPDMDVSANAVAVAPTGLDVAPCKDCAPCLSSSISLLKVCLQIFRHFKVVNVWAVRFHSLWTGFKKNANSILLTCLLQFL